MKIKALLLSLLLFFGSHKAFSKERIMKESVNLGTSYGLNLSNKDYFDPKLRTFNFEKVMKEAKAYFEAASSWKKLKCTAKNSFVCTKNACFSKKTQSYAILDRKKGMIHRCEGKVCDNIPAKFNQLGVFVNIQSKGVIGTTIRVLGDNRYKEIATVGLDAYIANGNCEVVIEEEAGFSFRNLFKRSNKSSEKKSS